MEALSMLIRFCTIGLLATCGVWTIVPRTALGQDSSLMLAPPIPAKQRAELTLDNSSFIYRKLPPEAEKRELQLNDIIVVLVDYKSALRSDGDANSKKTTSINAVLSDWLKFDGKSILPAPQAHGDPTIKGSLDSQFKTQANVKENDALTFKIGAKIVDIQPNGNLVVEGHSEVQNSDEIWERSLSGIVRRQSIGPDRTVRGDDVADLRILIRKKGFVHDATNRGWLTRWYDGVKPF